MAQSVTPLQAAEHGASSSSELLSHGALHDNDISQSIISGIAARLEN
jgi:hypothetical protein